MSMNQKISKRDVQNVKLWFASFILLALDVVIFVICFLLEYLLWLYIVCAVILAAFITLYVRTTKAITHKDGYTLIQAMQFYKVCRNAGIGSGHHTVEEKEQLYLLAVRFDYSSGLTQKQVLNLYQTGNALAVELGRE